MTERIVELVHRNLQEVFGEGDAALRRAAIDEFYHDDCVLYVPPGAFVGRDALDKFAGDLRATHRFLSTHLMERPKLFTTVGFSPGALVREAKLPITPGWTS
jgi:hypothetical protein